MANAWNGGDPVEVVDADDYELGVVYRCDADLTISHLRIWSGAGEVNVTSRKGKVWSSAGSMLANVTLLDNLTTGWANYALDAPLEIDSGTTIMVSYSTGGNYGADPLALNGSVTSADGQVVALAAALSIGGRNGKFNTTPGQFPNNGVGTNPFYGVDFVYTLGHGDNTAPRITDTSAVADQLQVTAAAVVEDDETLTGLELRIEWGDGNASTVVYPTLSATHTYAAPGVYPLLFRATDAGDLVDYAADYVITTSPDPTLFTLEIQGLSDAVCAAAQRIGHLDTVDGHEPREAPNSAMHAAFWLLSIRPARVSGLASVATCITFLGRLYVPAGDGTNLPYDEIDQQLLAATDRLMAAFIGKFTLGGRVRNVDVFGAHSPGLGADAGYVAFGKSNFRVMTITLPLIVNDMYEEVP